MLLNILSFDIVLTLENLFFYQVWTHVAALVALFPALLSCFSVQESSICKHLSQNNLIRRQSLLFVVHLFDRIPIICLSELLPYLGH